jgi:hypothetical protein
MVDPAISLSIVKSELAACEEGAKRYGWIVSDIDVANQLFSVRMESPVDREQYILELKFDNYKEWPLYLEFVDPVTKERGTKNAYPRNEGENWSFFHSQPCICSPCSRKAYAGFSDVHKDWTNLQGWQQHEKTGELKNIGAILRAVFFRISSDKTYKGRMK